MGEEWDAPNQQVVRADESAPWDEGTGGEPGTPAAAEEQEPAGLAAMTKAQLLERAQQLGVSPANNDMTKDELRQAIEEAESGS